MCLEWVQEARAADLATGRARIDAARDRFLCWGAAFDRKTTYQIDVS